eukprot:gene2969-3240_t
MSITYDAQFLQALGYSSQDLALTSGFCLLITALFFFLEQRVQTEKSKSWIVMLISSTVLSIVGIIYAFYGEFVTGWTIEFLYAQESFSRSVLLFFLASNIMDIALGLLYYPKQMELLTTYFHHTFYVAFITGLLSAGYSRGFMLCFFMEIPTFFLALGTVWSSMRSDLSFGVSFLFTRLLYNAYMVYRLYSLHYVPVIWKICLAVLGLHVFWFSKWVKGYGKKLFRKEKSLPSPTVSKKEKNGVESESSKSVVMPHM